MNLRERYLRLTPPKTQARAVRSCPAAAAVTFLMLPSASELRRVVAPLRLSSPSAPPARPVKRSPFDDRPNTAARPTAPQLPETAAGLPTPGALLGSYSGRGLLPRRGVCMLSVELRGQASEAGPVVADPTLQCTNLSMFVPGARARGARPITPEEVMAATGRLSPVSWVLSGAWEGGEIRFRVDKTIGAGDGCGLSSATVTPFGMRQVAFEGQGGTCGNWQMLLAKVGP